MAFRDREWSSTPTPDEISSRLAQLIMGNDEEKLQLSEDLEARGNRAYDELIPKENPKQQKPDSSFASSLAWMVINTLATIGIVRPTPFPHPSSPNKQTTNPTPNPRSSPTKLSSLTHPSN